MIVTLDGPAGSGKSSVAAAVAKALFFKHLNTGLIYRSFALYFLQKYPLFDFSKESSENYIPEDSLLFFEKVSLEFDQNGSSNIFLDQINITDCLDNPKVSEVVAKISQNRLVRSLVFDIQQKVASKYNLVVDGRDCGSHVFPDAEFKFFLTASLQVRAERILSRISAAKNKDDEKDFSFESVAKKIAQRDFEDINRSISPLVVPKEAIIIDSSNLSFQETVDKILQHINGQQ